MKKLLMIVVLLTAALTSQAQWSQKIVDKYTDSGRKISTSLINYEDSIGTFYFDETFNNVFYLVNSEWREFAATRTPKGKKVTGKIELFNEYEELVETINNYQFVPEEEEYATIVSDKVNAKGVSQRQVTKKILDFIVNEKGYVRFTVPTSGSQKFIFRIPCKQIA